MPGSRERKRNFSEKRLPLWAIGGILGICAVLATPLLIYNHNLSEQIDSIHTQGPIAEATRDTMSRQTATAGADNPIYNNPLIKNIIGFSPAYSNDEGALYVHDALCTFNIHHVGLLDHDDDSATPPLVVTIGSLVSHCLPEDTNRLLYHLDEGKVLGQMVDETVYFDGQRNSAEDYSALVVTTSLPEHFEKLSKHDNGLDQLASEQPNVSTTLVYCGYGTSDFTTTNVDLRLRCEDVTLSKGYSSDGFLQIAPVSAQDGDSSSLVFDPNTGTGYCTISKIGELLVNPTSTTVDCAPFLTTTGIPAQTILESLIEKWTDQ